MSLCNVKDPIFSQNIVLLLTRTKNEVYRGAIKWQFNPFFQELGRFIKAGRYICLAKIHL